jgi:hypothetical protein
LLIENIVDAEAESEVTFLVQAVGKGGVQNEIVAFGLG